MSAGSLRLKTIGQKQFLVFAYGFLGLAFLLMMIQNVIRYGSHDSYRPLRSLFYLVNSMVLFVPLLPVSIWVAKKHLLTKESWYFPLGFLWICLTIGGFYLYSNFSLYLFNYYDEAISSTYARYYFSREALLHLIVLAATLFFVWNRKDAEKEALMITGSLGRKKISLPLSSIHWIASDDHYLKLHSEHMTLLKRGTMKEMEENLSPMFMRIHRKHLVNRSEIVGHIKEKRGNYLLLSSGEKLKVGNSYLSVLDELPIHDK